MKKVFLFFTFLGISLGLFLGIRSVMLNEDEEIYIEQSSGDIYVHELNIPIMQIDTLNPLLTYNKQIQDLMGLIYEPLVEIGKNEMLEPILASEWAKKDSTNWIIKLRKGVRWHNGTLFTAEDVIFTINELKKEENNSAFKSNVMNIVSVNSLDDYSISITLNERDDLFMYKLCFPIIPKYYFKNGDISNEYKNNKPVGTGAYKYIMTNEFNNTIKLEKNDAWWNINENTKLESIYLYLYPTYGEAIKAYKSSDVDLIVTTMSDWEKKFGTIGNNIYSYESSIFDIIVPNTNKLALSDSSVRKAILTAINRENIVSKVFNSNATITDLPIHTRSLNYTSNNQSEHSYDKAKQILINAGWENAGSGWTKKISETSCKLKFNLLVNLENDEHVRAAEIIKENLEEIDIGITVKKVKWTDYEKALNGGNFDLALASFDIKNELTILDMLRDGSTFNYAKYNNKNMNEIIYSIRSNYNSITMKELERLYKEETPYIGLYFRNNTLLTNKSVKGSVEPFWNNPYFNITSWCK